MGSERHYPEEGPVREVTVGGFWIDACAVTNAEFSRFVAETGYQTVAERPLDPVRYPGVQAEMLIPGSLVFRKAAGPVDRKDLRNWWSYVPGASWRHPEGPGTSTEGLEEHPVVHVAYADAKAYARWAGKDLPTEAEWEFAARGGLDQAAYCWGEAFMPDGRHMANTWQGNFPYENLAEDGFERTAPVGSYPANSHGLYDMAGNVWEWTSDWFATRHPLKKAGTCCTLDNPRGPGKEGSFDPAQPEIEIPRKVVKGGSFLCAPSYCLRYRPAARQPQMIDSAMSHVGFRCIRRDSSQI
nr:formylglycine-generating enzyme family protein [Geminicoccus roseus]